MTTNRATNLIELGDLFDREHREWVRKKGLQVKLRPSDVVITPYGKSGTTWTQQIVHTLRTRGAIVRIAEFANIELDDDLLSVTLEQSSREYMLRHQDRFDDAMLRKQSEELAGLPPGSESSKVTAGSSTLSLSDESMTLFDKAWQEEITEPLGYTTYGDLIAALAFSAQGRLL